MKCSVFSVQFVLMTKKAYTISLFFVSSIKLFLNITFFDFICLQSTNLMVYYWHVFEIVISFSKDAK